MNCSVLIVEDDLIVAEHMKTFLLESGYDIFGVVQSGRTALNLVKENPPDIVIMDVKLDDLNGHEAAVVIRGFFEEKVPIVFITAYPLNDNPLIKAKIFIPEKAFRLKRFT